MSKFIFKTTTTMKKYNHKKWWIDSNIVREKHIEADTLEKALEKYRDLVYKNECISISDNAIKCKQPMYIDSEKGPSHVGYVITGKCDFVGSSQYIDLWVSIITVTNTEFKEV